MKKFTRQMLASAMAATLAVSSLAASAITASALVITDGSTTDPKGEVKVTKLTVSMDGKEANSLQIPKFGVAKKAQLFIAAVTPADAEVQGVEWRLIAPADARTDAATGATAYEAYLENKATEAGNAVYTDAGLAANGTFAAGTYAEAKAYVDGPDDLAASATGDGFTAKYTNTKATITTANFGTYATAMLAAFNGSAVADNTAVTEEELASAVAAANDALHTAVITAANTELSNDVVSAKAAARTNAANIAAANEAKEAAATIDEDGYYKTAEFNDKIAIRAVNSEGEVDANPERNRYIQVTALEKGRTFMKAITEDYTVDNNGKKQYKSQIVTIDVLEAIPVTTDTNAAGDEIGFKFNSDSYTIGKDSTLDLTKEVKILGAKEVDSPSYEYRKASATVDDIEWTSSNTNVIEIEKKTGKVTIKGVGQAYITAKLTDSYRANPRTFTQELAINVTEAAVVKTVKFAASSTSLKVGEEKDVKIEITPNEVTNSELDYKFSANKTDYVSVTDKGTLKEGNSLYRVVTLKGLKTGNVTLIAQAASGVLDTMEVTVADSGQTVKDTGVTLDHTSGTINVGQQVELFATITPANATDDSLTWTSSDDTVATVEYKGKVTEGGKTKYLAYVKGLKKGLTTIRVVTAAGNTARAEITVQEDGSSSWTEAKLDITDPDTATYDMKNTLVHQIAYTVTPADSVVTWSSSNTAVATVDSKGNVTFVAPGTTNITASTTKGTQTLKDTVQIKVVNTTSQQTVDDPLYITLDGKTKKNIINVPNVDIGFQMIPVLQGPAAGYNANELKWATTSNLTSVSPTGYLKYTRQDTFAGYSYNETLVTVSTYDGKYSAQVIVDFHNNLTIDQSDIAVDSLKITLDGKNEINEIKAKWKSNLKDKTTQLLPLIGGTNYTSKDVEWSVDKADLAKIDSTGGLTIIAPKDKLDSQGNASFTVTAKTHDGKLIDTANVVISSTIADSAADIKTADPAYTGDPYTLEVDGKKVADKEAVPFDSPDEGKTKTAQAKAIFADDSPYADKDIVWSSSNDKVAAVDANGKVTIKPVTKDSEATITAKTTDGKYSKSFIVKVKAPENDIPDASLFTVNPDSITFDSPTADPKTIDADTDKYPIKWTSQDPKVAKVSPSSTKAGEKPTITPVGAGTTYIVGTDANGDEVKIKVTVKAANDNPYAGMSQAEIEALINQKIQDALAKQQPTIVDPGNGKTPTGNPKTGVGLAVIPAAVAGVGAFIFRKKRK